MRDFSAGRVVLRRRKNSFFCHSAYYRAFARLARKIHGEDFVHAYSYSARDELSRMVAGECYDLAQEFAKAGEQELSLQYMNLAARLLDMSLRPKKLLDLEEIKRTLARLNAQKASK